MITAHSSRTGTCYGASQSSFGGFRRPTAAALRLHKLQLPFSGVTQQSSAPTQTHDQEALEAAMRAAKNGTATSNTSNQGSGSNGTVNVKEAISESAWLKEQFNRIKAEVDGYKTVVQEKKELEDKKQELESQLAAQMKEKAELEAKLAMQQAEFVQAIEAARTEVAEPLQRRLETQATEHEEQLRRAVTEAKQEVAGPLQQQLEELAMQLQNSQAQLERLGGALEAAEVDKATAVQALQEENQQLLLAVEGGTARLAAVVYPPGSLPHGMTVSTRLAGSSEAEQLAEAEQAAAAASTTSSVQTDDAVAAAQATVQEHKAAPAQPRPREGFFAKLLGVVRFWIYHLVGAVLLFYAATNLVGMPPLLNLEFGLGCVVVCTLLSWANHLFFPRFSS